MPPIKYILFDCDNTLVLSESIAFEACADLANEILESKGIKDRYTGPKLLKDFVGQNFRGMLTGLQERHHFELDPEQMDDYVGQELSRVTEKLKEKAQPCEGALDQLKKLGEHKKYGMAVVSSSALPRVDASIEKTGMRQWFPDGYIFSAATSLPKPTSKPNPAIYNFACEKLGVKNAECVAIEDSRSGATAAKNAKIPLIGYVGPYEEEGKEHQDAVAKMLKEECGAIVVMYHWNEFEDALKKVIEY